MASPLLLLLLLLLLLSAAANTSAAAASDAQLLLDKIKPALQGSTTNLELSSWNSSTPLCLWRGLTWSSSSTTTNNPLPCFTSPSLRSNLSLSTDPTLLLLSIHLPAAALAGTLPPALGLLSSLRSLLLPVNSLSGPIPLELANAPSLSDLDLSSNLLSGLLPLSFWNLCPRAASLRLSSNHLSGPIPPPPISNASCPRLRFLDLSRNRLSGDLPAFLPLFTNLQSLDLAGNRLAGTLPSLATLPQLQRLNLSDNNFTGPLPAGYSKYSAAAFAGNNHNLCGPPLRECGSPRGAGLSPGAVAGIVIGLMAGAVVLASLSIGWVQGRRRRRRGYQREEKDANEDEEAEDENGGEGRLVVFAGGEHLTLDDVLNATGQVMEKTSYGAVYKAKLADGGTIALRLLREGSCRDTASCLPVVRQLGRARHENLVPLRAFYHGKRGEQLLIYDYLPNRTLHHLLHVNAETKAEEGRPMLLNWSRRHKIALGVARGLAYLHTRTDSPITHGNVRSRNVLVDEFFVARLMECGLGKLMVPAVAAEMVVAAKSGGYKAPELQKMSKCSARTDVYAFGIMLLEILMGKRPGKGEEGVDLPSLVKVAVLEDTTMEVFDVDVLKGVRNPTEDGLVQALRLAMGCCAPVAAVRPDMSEVVRQLEENRPRNMSALYTPTDDTRSETETPL